jgi:hypothetical protein
MNHVPFEGGDAELFRKMRRDGGSHPEKIDESLKKYAHVYLRTYD